MIGGNEKRKDTRQDTSVSALFGRENTDQLVKVLCRNISNSGTSLLTPKVIPLGTRCQLKIPDQGTTAPHFVKAEVVWQGKRRVEELGFSGYPIGLRFLQSNGFKASELLLTIETNKREINDPTTDNKVKGKQSRWQFPANKYIYEKRIFLKHTNVEGNTYYDNYISWQGEAREALLLSHPEVGEFLKPENFVKMITHTVHQRYIQDTFFGDAVRIEVTSRDIKHCSFVMVFRYYKQTNQMIGEGWQKICFADLKLGKICRIPETILDLIKPIEENTQKSNEPRLA